MSQASDPRYLEYKKLLSATYLKLAQDSDLHINSTTACKALDLTPDNSLAEELSTHPQLSRWGRELRTLLEFERIKFAFQRIFGDEMESFILTDYHRLQDELIATDFSAMNPIFDGLEFLSLICGMAQWKYSIELNDELYELAGKWDRLDDPGVRSLFYCELISRNQA